MAKKVLEAALQYSKKLSKWITFFWISFRFAVLIVAGIVPETAPHIINLVPGVDTVMMVNVGCYLVNSLGEKIVYSDRFVLSWIAKGGFKNLLGIAKNVAKLNNDINSEDDNSSDEDEEGSNG